MKKGAFLFSFVIMISITFTGCYKMADEGYTVSNPGQSVNVETPVISADKDTVYETRIRYWFKDGKLTEEKVQVPATFANPDNIFDIGTEVELNGLKYKVNGEAEITQDSAIVDSFQGGEDIKNENFLNVPESKRWFISVDLTITNDSHTEKEQYLNSLYFVGINDNLVIYENLGYLSDVGEYDFIDGEPRGMTNAQNNGKSLFKYTFKPRETLHTKLLLITNDRTLNYNLYFCDPEPLVNSSNKFLKFYSKVNNPNNRVQ